MPSVAALAMLWLWLRSPTIGWLSGPGWMAAGLCAWTLLEYLLHRRTLHRVEPFRGWHLQHHLRPDVPMRTPVVFSAMLILPVVSLPILLYTLNGPDAAFSLGLLVGHLLQEIVHHRLHMAQAPDQPMAPRALCKACIPPPSQRARGLWHADRALGLRARDERRSMTGARRHERSVPSGLICATLASAFESRQSRFAAFTALVGSTNFDNRSFRLNEEANLNVDDKAFAERAAIRLRGGPQAVTTHHLPVVEETAVGRESAGEACP